MGIHSFNFVKDPPPPKKVKSVMFVFFVPSVYVLVPHTDPCLIKQKESKHTHIHTDTYRHIYTYNHTHIVASVITATFLAPSAS